MDERLTARGKHRRRGLTVLIALICLLSSLAFGFRPDVYPLQAGIDASYMFAANYASVRGLRWGQDFVSTFGPYVYLIQAVDLGSIPFKKLVSEFLFLLLAGLACTLYIASRRPIETKGAVFLAVLLPYAVHLQGGEQRWFAVLVVLLLVGVTAPRLIGLASFSAASLLAGFFLLVKLSLGVGGVLSILAGCILTERPRIFATRTVLLGAGVGSGFLLGWLAHQGTFEGIAGFGISALPVVSGYSSAMSLDPHGWQSSAVYFAYFALVLALWSLASRNRSVLLTAAACVAPLFVEWKQAMVRQDAGHTRAFVLFGIFVLCAFSRQALELGWRKAGLLLALTVPGLLAPWFFPSASRADRGPGNLVDRLVAPFRFRFDLGYPPRSNLEGLRISDHARAMVGENTIDIYPWESVYVAANDFVWRNRPSTASFATYTPELDELNRRFFSSVERPRFLLWHATRDILSIDGRHLFWDEPSTLRQIVSSYGIVVRESVFLLEELEHPRLSEPRLVRIVEAGWDAWVSAPEVDGVLLAAAKLERPWWLSLRKALLREDTMFISVRFEGGDERTFRFVPDQAQSGLWMSPLPRDVQELGRILRGNFSQARTEAIKFHGNPDFGPIVVTWSVLNLR